MTNKMMPIAEYILLELRKREVLKNINNIRSSLLDVCCGKNYPLIKALHHRYKNRRIEFHGIDMEVDNNKIDNIVLKKLIIKNKLPYKSNYFDKVIMMACLEHLEHPKNILREAHRVLKTNGKIIITTPTNDAEKILDILIRLKLTKLEHGMHRQNYTPLEVEKLLENTGFIEIKSKPFEFGFNIIAVGNKNRKLMVQPPTAKFRKSKLIHFV